MTLRGLLLPVTTPFEPEERELDRSAFVENLRRWLAGPVDGLVVAGSTGEAPLLDEVELLRLVEWGRSSVGDGRPLVAGTGLESTRGTLRLCREVARAGADAVLVRPPHYYRDAMTPAAVEDHYRRVADGSPLPVVLYNIPRYVSVELDPELVGRLARHENVAGIKDSSGEVRNAGELVEVCGSEASVLVGAGTLLYGGLEIGAEGGVLAVGLLAPELCGEILEAFDRGESSRAGELQERVGALDRAVVGDHGVAGVKHALDRLGWSGGPVRPPLQPLDGVGERTVEEALEAAGLL